MDFARTSSPMRFNIRQSVSYSVYFYFALLLLLIPFRLFLSWLGAVVLHELCHMGTVYILGGRVEEISVQFGAVKMVSGPLSKWRKALSVAAGPLGGALGVLFRRFVPEFALCCWCLSLYNLLPFSFLDGGHLLELFLSQKWLRIIQSTVMLVLAVLAVALTFLYRESAVAMVLILILWLRIRKIPCNAQRCKVQ